MAGDNQLVSGQQLERGTPVSLPIPSGHGNEMILADADKLREGCLIVTQLLTTSLWGRPGGAMMHIMSTRNRSEFLAVPELIRFSPTRVEGALQGCLLIKTSTLTLKYLATLRSFRMCLFRLRTDRKKAES